MSNFEKVAAQLAESIQLGYEAEQDDPKFQFAVPPQDEIRWLGAWLASEGWTRDADWRRR